MDFGNKKIKLEKYDANRMDSSTQNMDPKLIGLTYDVNSDAFSSGLAHNGSI